MTRRSRRLPVLAVLTCLLMLAVSCGRKTDPLTPDSPRSQAVTDLQAVARDGIAFLSWAIPTKNIEGKDMDPGEIREFRVYRAELEGDKKKARYRQVAEISLANPEPAQVRNGRVYWQDTHVRYEQPYGYRVRAITARGGPSLPSEEVRVVPLLSLAAPRRLTAEAGDSRIVLAWEPVTTRSDGSVYTGFIGYNIYRGTEPGREAETPINPEPVRTAGYKDTSVRNNVTYYYFVRAVDSPARPWKESLNSPEVAAMARDLTPPEQPAGLTVVPGVGRVFLTWNENKDRDLAGYHVYRSHRSGRDYQRLTDKPINRTTYSDESVKPGIQYFYAITAVDRSLNESTFSKEQRAYAEKMR